MIKSLSAYKKLKKKGKWEVPGKRSSSFIEILSESLQDYLEDAINIGKECGVLIQAGGYVKLGSKFENYLIQNNIGKLQDKVREFLMERKNQSQ